MPGQITSLDMGSDSEQYYYQQQSSHQQILEGWWGVVAGGSGEMPSVHWPDVTLTIVLTLTLSADWHCTANQQTTTFCHLWQCLTMSAGQTFLHATGHDNHSHHPGWLCPDCRLQFLFSYFTISYQRYQKINVLQLHHLFLKLKLNNPNIHSESEKTYHKVGVLPTFYFCLSWEY